MLLLTACSGAGSSAPRAATTPVVTSPTPTPTVTLAPPKPPPPPPVGACYRLGYADALAPTSARPPVPCSRTHTAVTFYVGRYSRSLPVDGPAVHALEATACPRRFATFVGGTVEARRLSMLRTIWFTPTVAQAAKGAHWFRCVAIALYGDGHLAPLIGPVRGALGATTTLGRYGLCGTAEPGTTGFQERICAAPHSWRALQTVPFPAGPYPGQSRVRAAGQQPCQDAGRAAAADPLSYRWSYQWPTAQEWRAGRTYGVCWAPG